MKLATSTGDFGRYAESMEEILKNYEGTKFKYINLGQSRRSEHFSENEDDWRKLADNWGNAAASAGVTFVVSHAPCLHTPCLNEYKQLNEEEYSRNIRAIRRSLEICNVLGIKRIVVHACPNFTFSVDEFYAYNKKFYMDLFELMEKYDITVMTENWDDSRTHFSTGKDLRDFIDYMDHPLLAACWDTAHGNIDKKARELGQYQNITDIGDKLKGLHISDNFGDTHHHSWPFAGIINFDSVMQGLIDVQYDGYFTFEASYTLLHQNDMPYNRKPWEHNGQMVTKLLNPSIELKRKAVNLLYSTGEYILKSYDCFEI